MNTPPLPWSAPALETLRDTYRDGLLGNTLPFWLPRSVDTEHGGYLHCLDRDGSLLQSDKAVWPQGRMAWMFSSLYLTAGQNPEWLEAARRGIEFLNAHCFDIDGRMFFLVTREGRPLRKRRYQFSECFAIIALAAYSRATGEACHAARAEALLRRVIENQRTPGLLPPKVDPQTRPMKGLAMPMILLVTAQELRKAGFEPFCREVIDECIAEIERDFWKPEFNSLLETVGPNGEFIDNFDGRCINPGHSIEAGWFILEEARVRGNDPRLIALGTRIIDGAFEAGWDQEYGGMLYFRDARGLPPTEYWHDMKFWWPHNETIIATLMAGLLTGDPKYARWHTQAHEWAYAHFPDAGHGEWYGYLHRDGRLSTPLKGNVFKSFFHLPRMEWTCWQRLDEALARQPAPTPLRP